MIEPVLNSNNNQSQPVQSQQIKQQIQFKIINGSQQQQQQQQQVHHTTYNMSQQNIANSPNRNFDIYNLILKEFLI